jgi:hypothetical protein
MIVLLRIALEQHAGLGKEAARKHVVSALKRTSKQIGLRPASSDAIRHWERDLETPLEPQDEQQIAQALKRCGNDAAQLTRHFLGLVEFARKPLPVGARWR